GGSPVPSRSLAYVLSSQSPCLTPVLMEGPCGLMSSPLWSLCRSVMTGLMASGLRSFTNSHISSLGIPSAISMWIQPWSDRMPSLQLMTGMQKEPLMPKPANGSFQSQLSPASSVAHDRIFPEVLSSLLPRKCEYPPLSSWDVSNIAGSFLGHIIG